MVLDVYNLAHQAKAAIVGQSDGATGEGGFQEKRLEVPSHFRCLAPS